MQTNELTGISVIVTRSHNQADTFLDQLRHRGCNAIAVPALEILPPSSWNDFDCHIDHLDRFDWLILTSANAVNSLIKRLKDRGYGIEALSNLNVAVVGQKTASQLNKHGVSADFIPPKFISESLVAHFPDKENLANSKILYPCLEEERRELLITEFTALGATVIDVPAYRSSCATVLAPEVLPILKKGVDVVTFASPKTAQCFYGLLQTYAAPLGASPEQILTKTAIASIGPFTSTMCQKVYGRVDIQPSEYTLSGLTTALVQWANDRK